MGCRGDTQIRVMMGVSGTAPRTRAGCGAEAGENGPGRKTPEAVAAAVSAGESRAGRIGWGHGIIVYDYNGYLIYRY